MENIEKIVNKRTNQINTEKYTKYGLHGLTFSEDLTIIEIVYNFIKII